MKITQSKAKKMMANIKIEVSENDYSEKVNDVLKKYRKNKSGTVEKIIKKASMWNVFCVKVKINFGD